MQFQEDERSNMSILRASPTTKCARVVPSLRVTATTRVCGVASLANIDILAALRSLHPSRSGRNALHVGPIQRFPDLRVRYPLTASSAALVQNTGPTPSAAARLPAAMG